MPPDNDPIGSYVSGYNQTGQDTDQFAGNPEILEQLLLASNQSEQKRAGEARANAGAVIDLAQQAKVQAVSHAERLAGILATASQADVKAIEAKQVLDAQVLGQRNSSMMQLGGMQTIDQLGAAIPQAMQAAKVAQARFDQAQKSANPIMEGLLQAFGVKTDLVRAAEEADAAAGGSAQLQADRTALIQQMNASNSLANSLGAALNASAMEAHLTEQQALIEKNKAALAETTAKLGYTAWKDTLAADRDILTTQANLSSIEYNLEQKGLLNQYRIQQAEQRQANVEAKAAEQSTMLQLRAEKLQRELAGTLPADVRAQKELEMRELMQAGKMLNIDLRNQKLVLDINKQQASASQRLKAAGAGGALAELSAVSKLMVEAASNPEAETEKLMGFSASLHNQFADLKEQESLLARMNAELSDPTSGRKASEVEYQRSAVEDSKNMFEKTKDALATYTEQLLMADATKAGKFEEARRNAATILGQTEYYQPKKGSPEAKRYDTLVANQVAGVPLATGIKDLTEAVRLQNIEAKTKGVALNPYALKIQQIVLSEKEAVKRASKGSRSEDDISEATRYSLEKELNTNTFGGALPVDIKAIKTVMETAPNSDIANNDFVKFLVNRADVSSATLMDTVADYVEQGKGKLDFSGHTPWWTARQRRVTEASIALSNIYNTLKKDARYAELGIVMPISPVTSVSLGKGQELATFDVGDKNGLGEYLVKYKGTRVQSMFDNFSGGWNNGITFPE